jgi:hypothetical protein
LLLDEQAKKYRALDKWFKTPQGCRVADAFASELMQISEQLPKNGALLQLGSCGENTWLSAFQVRQTCVVSPFIIPQRASMVSSLSMLPIERDSVDCVIAPLTLEAFSGSKSPIDEIDRILKPMGYAIFFGINPFSFWGAALRWGHLDCFGPVTTILTSSLTIRRMMLIRGYRQCILSGFYYIPPVKNDFLIQKLEFFNEMGKMVSPFPAAFYCFIAQKYQHCHPSLLAETASNRLILSKSTLQAATKWAHE